MRRVLACAAAALRPRPARRRHLRALVAGGAVRLDDIAVLAA